MVKSGALISPADMLSPLEMITKLSFGIQLKENASTLQSSTLSREKPRRTKQALWVHTQILNVLELLQLGKMVTLLFVQMTGQSLLDPWITLPKSRKKSTTATNGLK